MANTSPARIWSMRAAFPGLALLIIFFRLLPLGTLPLQWAPPDLLLALAFAWALRRPDFLPVPILAATLLLADLALQRPPGLMALLAVLGCEYLGTRAAPSRDTTFAAEWLAVAAVLTSVLLANRLILTLTGVAQAQLSLTLIQLVLTIAAYPLVALASQSLLGVRRLSAAEAEAMGARP